MKIDPYYLIGIPPLAFSMKQEAMASCFRLIMNAQWVQTISSHVFQAEVYALLYCARLENLVYSNNSSVAICCDSLAAINAVSAVKATTGLVADDMKALKSLAVFNRV